jgi:signal transduction histidine kinase
MKDKHLTKAIETEKKLKKEEAKFSALINSLGEAVFVVNPVGKITFYNAAALDFLDIHDGIFEKSFTTILPLTSKDGAKIKLLDEVLKKSRVVIRDDLLSARGNNKINIYVNINPITEGTKILGALILVRDVSKQKNLEEQKNEFISLISHELRVPLAVVEGDLSTALLPGYAQIEEKAKKLLENARQNLIYLSGLLQDLTSLSQAEKSLLDIEISVIRPKELISEIKKDFSMRVEQSNARLKVDIDNDLPDLRSSRQRIKEILVNFLTNAIKYSGEGKLVTLRAKVKDASVQFSVTDQGIGISQSDQKKLFEKAFRSEDEQARRVKGTGMGLYICKKQADRIGAKLWFESKFRHGSTFYLEVPKEISQKVFESK